MPDQPLAEVFGYPVGNFSDDAEKSRKERLCPFRSEEIPNAACTKTSVTDPLGVCSVFGGSEIAITCPVRFIQEKRMVNEAARFFFPSDATWKTLVEVPLRDIEGKPAGNIDIVLVSYDEHNRILDYGALEVQAVYISGNVREPFRHYMENPRERHSMNWRRHDKYPRPDYLSSSRKRLAPQLVSKGGILNAWNRKMAVALNTGFFNRLPLLEQVDKSEAEIAWLIYDLQLDPVQNRYFLVPHRTVFTKFEAALLSITRCEAGAEQGFLNGMQAQLLKGLKSKNAANTAKLHTDF